MSLPINSNLIFNAGDSWEAQFTINDLVGAIVFSEIRDRRNKLIKTFTSSIDGNVLSLSVASASTTNVKKDVYRYDVRIKRGPEIKTEYKGEILVL